MIIGVGWYSADQWTMLKLTADDPEALDATYDQWRAGAERTLQQLKMQPGIRAVKVPVDVQVLRQWCREHGSPLDGGGRANFIAEQVKIGCYDDDAA
jgi:hypothetical protein